jgi:exonuclease III
VTYNTNCLFSAADKATGYSYISETIEFLGEQNILLLQELGASNALTTAQQLLPNHTFYVTCHPQLRKGYGVAAAISRDIAHTFINCNIHSEYHQMVHVPLCISPYTVHVLSCYIPHEKSKQLPELDLPARHSFLQQLIDSITSSSPAAIIIAAGDLNAKVGEEQALGPAALAAINAHNAVDVAAGAQQIHTNRKQQYPQLDAPGTMLNDLCQATNIINLTGVTPDDCPALPSYNSTSNTASSRLDHFLVSSSCLKHIWKHQVFQCIQGSDHYPIMLSLNMLPTTSKAKRNTTFGGRIYYRIKPSTDPTSTVQYMTTITDPVTWQEYDALCTNNQPPDPTELQQCFNRTIFKAARIAGYRIKPVGYPKQPSAPRTKSKFKVWHDSECKALKRKFKQLEAILHRTATEQQQLDTITKEYRQRVKNLLRKHRAADAKH